MAMQSGQSPIKGLGAAAAASRGKPIEIGRSRLPAGINNGVARLQQCGIGVYEPDHKKVELRGKHYFSAMGVVVSPEEHNGTPVRGLQTWLQRIPLCDTPNAQRRKTLADNFNAMRSHLIALGFDVDAATADIPPEASDDAVLAVIAAGCKALGQQRPYFRFRTWQGKKDEIVERGGKWFIIRRGGQLGPYPSKELLLKANPYAENDPLINEQWEGAVTFSENGEDALAVEDATGDETDDDAAVGGGVAGVATEAGEPPDLDALAAAADAADVAAQRRLDALADELGVSEEAGAAATYAEAVEIIRAAQNVVTDGDESATEEAVEEGDFAEEKPTTDGPWQPAPGEEYSWRPADPKDKSGKRRLKAISVLIDKVYEKGETVTLISNVTKKSIIVSSGPNKGKPLAVKWSELEQI